jgi:hypothetical protein
MKIKERTKRVFSKWCETHKMSDTFILEGVAMKGSEVKKLIHGDVEVKPAPKIEDTINIDIQEEEHADMGEPFDHRDTEEY